jgi:hypothetical protein
MQSDDKPINGQHINGQHNPNFLDLLNQTPPPPDAKHWPRPKRFAGLRAAWRESWQQGGFLYQRWEELLQARHAGWHEIAVWIKTAGLLAGISLIVMMVDAAGDIASATLKGLSAVPATSAGDGSGLWGTVDHPIRVFLADQAAHLSVAPAALYAFWQLTGLLGLIGGFFGNAGARIAWTLWGLASLAMIWSAAPAARTTPLRAKRRPRFGESPDRHRSAHRAPGTDLVEGQPPQNLRHRRAADRLPDRHPPARRPSAAGEAPAGPYHARAGHTR